MLTQSHHLVLHIRTRLVKQAGFLELREHEQPLSTGIARGEPFAPRVKLAERLTDERVEG
eukprot:scaffold288830_cov30-Tisochrysis_lutea.AAC.3